MGVVPPSFKERRDWLRLSRSENVGPQTFQVLLERYGDATTALEALPELSAKGGIRRTIKIYSAERAEADIEHADALDARFITWLDPEYPALLREIADPPPIICIKGTPDVLQRPMVSIVGSRNASALGRKLARTLAHDLGEAGFTVVSGLARGIDTAAHDGSVETGTVAVLAGGIDNIYPPENEELYLAIGAQGLLISEHVVGTKPQAQNFPRRNRLVSGMCYGVVVIEAALRSGSLITARLALEQNREVFAVPGNPMDPRAEGTNNLIKNGAVLLRDANDVADVLAPIIGDGQRSPPNALADRPVSAPPTDPTTPPETGHAGLMQLVGATPVDIDDLIRESEMTASQVMSLLLELELAGTVERLPQQKVLRIPK